jgi:asparagine synthase (glutamine-hydrolysing)
MCGIVGVIAFDGASVATVDTLRRMCDTVRHRGPDEEGIDIEGRVGLGMRRLSIIDVAGGNQPLFNEDRTVRLVFNGEIYNYRELRRELESRGHRFATRSDGEVAVHLWEDNGAELVCRLNGMFAIAIHDSRRQQLLLVRDRIGVKPLFFYRSAEHLVFGSEIKALLASGLVPRDVDLDGLADFLTWEYVPAPSTLFRGVRKLEPAHLLEVDLATGTGRTRRYWDVPAPGTVAAGPRTGDEWIEAIDATLGESVRRQLVSDVPLGAFLSGGVDSSLVVSHMGEARTFSIGFDDPSYNELNWSRSVARHLGVAHRTEVIRPDVVELFGRLMEFMDDPIGDFSIFPTFLVSRLARRDVKVVLSGDGGDELFGGYETYLAQRKERLWRILPQWLRTRFLEPVVEGLRPSAAKKGLINKAKRFVEGTYHARELRHARWRMFLAPALRRELFTEEALDSMTRPPEDHVLRLFEEARGRDELNRQLYVDLNSYLVDNCLVKVDRMSMACSLEARVPFLDHELVELAFRVPPELKISRGVTKAILKRVAERRVPRDCVYRPKEGFSIPIKQWLGTQFRPLTDTLLDPQRITADGIFRSDTIQRLKREHLEGRQNHSHVLWSLMVFEDWRERWAS